MNAPLTNQFLRYASGHPARRFRENSLCFSKELDRANNLHIRNIFSPATALANEFAGVIPIRGIANGQRARNRVRLLRLKTRKAALHRRGNWRASSSLGAEEFHRLIFHPAKRDQFVESLGYFSDQ